MAERGPVSDTVPPVHHAHDLTPPEEPPASPQGAEHATPQVSGEEQVPMGEALARLAEATAALNTATTALEDTGWVEALHQLRDLRRSLDTLHQLESSIVRHAYLHGEHGKRIIDGLGEVWVGRGRAKERWEGTAAVQAYIDQKMAAVGGELTDPLTVAEWVLEVVPASKLRVTPLREVGLDPEDFRSSEPGTLSVTLPT